eukprot:jgi/Tetstr1/444058/TSEL_031996.t1
MCGAVGVITKAQRCSALATSVRWPPKPVMEGKAVLFKKFADLDSFRPRVVDMGMPRWSRRSEASTWRISRPPECFYARTAIIAGAGLLNALDLVVKEISQIKVVVCGCGAAGFTCAKYFLSLGVKKKNLICIDLKGVVYAGREDLTEDNYLCEVAVETEKRTLAEAIDGADVFLGLSAGGLLKPHLLETMKRDPIVFALANP